MKAKPIQSSLHDDPYARYYNLEGLTDVFLTCDVDWAPDYAIETVLNAVAKHGMKMTMFATHRSQVLLSPPSFLEVGLHPDFTRPNVKLEEKFPLLKEIYPKAVGTRSHRNFFGQNIADLAKAAGLWYDASSFLWNQPYAQCHVDYNGMTRFSYVWEDGIHLDMGHKLDFDGVRLFTPGMKIMNVHPILIYLNSSTEAHRRSVTSRYRDLTTASYAEVSAEVNSSRGIGDLWREMLQMMADSGIRTHCLRDAVEQARSA